MVEFTGYDEGTPCWVDLMTPDVEVAKRFYSALFGWDYLDTGEAGGGYVMATLRGKPVAGIGPQPPEQPRPSSWTTYLWTDDADATVRRVADAGGRVVVEPMDVAGAGRMAVVTDHAGSVFGLWQGREHRGAALANEPGTVTWNENLSDDLNAARDFYHKVFGYSYENFPKWPVEYDMFKVNGSVRGGIGMKPLEGRLITPNSWQTYFSVTDTDAVVDEVTNAGGLVMRPAQDTVVGRMAALVDPEGAPFSVISVPNGQQDDRSS
jgi:predicted enzyme related to lactoylglutathione lyase